MLHRLRASIHTTNLLVQVAATTVGLFLALGLDHWKTQRAHREDARQARLAVHEELRLNRTELLREIERTRASLATLRPLQEKLLKGERIDPRRLGNLGFSLATLRSAAWETGLATQALSHLEPWRLARISEAFSLQKDLDHLHHSLLDQVPTLSRLLVTRNPNDNPAFFADLNALITYFEVDLGSAQDTLAGYEAALGACQDGPPTR